MPRSFEEKYEQNIGIGAMLFNRLNDLKGEIKVQLPCRVKSVDYENNQVDVEILDYDHDEAGRLINYPIIPNVPIRQPIYSGSIYMILPVRVGDEGTIEFFDSSVADLTSTGVFDFDYSEEWHSINYGLFTNGFLSKNKVIPVDKNLKLVMASSSGTFIFKVNSNDELEITTPNMKLNGNLIVNGNINSNGTVTGTTDVVGGGKSLKSHTHTDSQGGSTTAPN